MSRQAFYLIILCVTFGQTQANKLWASDTVPTEKTCKVGICLSGGGAMGFAHIGALQALEEHNVKPDYISANSIGSIIGVLYAAGYSPWQILEMITKENATRFVRFLKPGRARNGGMFKYDKLPQVLDKYIPYDNFDSLQKQFWLCCTDIKQGKAVIVHKGEHLKDFVIASASIPYVFEYKIIDSVEYVDGGVKNNFPVEPLVEEGCDVIIGINLINYTPVENAVKRSELMPMLAAMIDETMNEHRYKLCDFYIPVKGMSNKKYGALTFRQYRDIYQFGYDSVIEYISQHPEILTTGSTENGKRRMEQGTEKTETKKE